MEVFMEREEGVLIARVEGRLDGSNAAGFEETIGTAIDESDRAVPIDCENLGFIGSAGLRVVLSIAKTLKSRNAGFALCSLSDPIREAFRGSGFDRIVAIHSSRAEALASFDC